MNSGISSTSVSSGVCRQRDNTVMTDQNAVNIEHRVSTYLSQEDKAYPNIVMKETYEHLYCVNLHFTSRIT